MDEKRMTPAEAWEGFVGSQTPAEFVDLYRLRGFIDIDAICTAYAQELPTMFDGWDHTNDLTDIANLLARYVRQALSNVREGW